MTLEKLIEEEVEENLGTNRIIYKRDDEFSRTVSTLGVLPARAIMLSSRFGKYPEEETADHVRQYLEDSGLEDTTVRIGHTRIGEDIKRLFTDKRLKDISLLGRIFLGIPGTIFGGLLGKLTRADHYNPMTKTVHVYSDIPAVALHELGHAKDFQEVGYPTLYAYAREWSPVELWQEYRASSKAHKALPENIKGQTGRFLIPAYATYIASKVNHPYAKLGILAGGHILGAIYNAYRGILNMFGKKDKEYQREDATSQRESSSKVPFGLTQIPNSQSSPIPA
jgi:hypothetical protein